MQLETFRGPDLHAVVHQVRMVLGEDAMIIRTHARKRAGENFVEVVAARAEAVEAFKRRLDGGAAAARRARSRRRIGPYRIALVGPGGSGKTTAAVKLALHPRGVGGDKRVGLISLDTYRVGAVEELQTYAEIADLPLEVLYHARETRAAIHRMRGCDVVLIDTPGRWNTESDEASWLGILRELDPDEVHLVLPAGLRIDVAGLVRERLGEAGITHVLFSKLDHLPNEDGLATLAEAVGLPTRWVVDGHDIPGSLAPAAPRILASLGTGARAAGGALRAG